MKRYLFLYCALRLWVVSFRGCRDCLGCLRAEVTGPRSRKIFGQVLLCNEKFCLAEPLFLPPHSFPDGDSPNAVQGHSKMGEPGWVHGLFGCTCTSERRLINSVQTAPHSRSRRNPTTIQAVTIEWDFQPDPGYSTPVRSTCAHHPIWSSKPLIKGRTDPFPSIGVCPGKPGWPASML